MKKGLFLLPLVGGLLLSACTFNLFGKEIKLFEKDDSSSQSGGSGGSGGGGSGGGGSGGGGSGGGGGGGGSQSAGQEVSTGGAKEATTASEDAVVFDFSTSTLKDQRVLPYVDFGDAGHLYTFDYEGITYNDIGCYTSAYQSDYYLMMKNTDWTGGDMNTAGFSNKLAFIGNAEPFAKPIKKVIVEVNGGSSSDVTVYRATIHTEPQTVAATEKGFVGAKGETFYTETTSDQGYYFTVSTNKNTEKNKTKNGQIKKITISF